MDFPCHLVEAHRTFQLGLESLQQGK
jgi:hypothetical protein